jgi:hypothetical protein
MSDFVDELIGIVSRLRKHASFWLWPNKPVAERGVVRELLNSMHHDGDMRYQNPRSVNDDWPDCKVDDEFGNTVAVEVTELVDEKAIRTAQRGEMDFSYRTDGEIKEQVSRILARKDLKSSHGGLYSKVILVIHTDEFTHLRLFPVIRNTEFMRLENIQEAFIITSYDPETHTYPWCEIQFKDRDKTESGRAFTRRLIGGAVGFVFGFLVGMLVNHRQE